MMLQLLAIQDWYSQIKIFVNTQIDQLTFIAIISFLIIAIMALFRFIVKYAFNVNAIKKNVVLPIILTIILGAILILLCTMRFV